MINENVLQPSTTEFGSEFEPIVRLDLTDEIISRIKVMIG